jgi:TonB family protein
MSEVNKHINYTAADIEKYWKGQLPVTEMHAMEKAALEDPFLADAMEGYQNRNLEFGINSPQSSFQVDISDLETRLAERVAEKKVVPIQTFNWWKVAAAIIILIGGVWLYTSLNNNNPKQSIAKKESAKDVPAIPKPDNTKTFINTDTLKDMAVTEKKKPVTIKNVSPSLKERETTNNLFADSSVSIAYLNKQTEVAKNEEKKEAKSNELVIAKPEIKHTADKSANAQLNGRVKGITTDDYYKTADLEKNANNFIASTFNGKVVDQLNQPVANATIQIPNLNIATQTDNRGNFSFKAPDTALSVSIASAGFETQNLKLQNSNNFSNQIILKPAAANLQEVVVTGYSTQKKIDRKTKDVTINILDAEPSIDWNAYSDYLEKNKNVPDDAKNIHGDVVLSFTVDSKGTLKNFKIQKSLNEQLDKEAIRLIKEGPSWRLLKGKKAKASVIVKF